VIPFPRPQSAAIVAGVSAALTPRTRIAVIDHITSPSALVLPIAEIVELCHSAGVPVLVDGAHAPGQISLDLRAIGADWYVGSATVTNGCARRKAALFSGRRPSDKPICIR
jgi:isopenicillin-N epimerase